MGGSAGGGEGEGCMHARRQGRDGRGAESAEERGGQVRGLLAAAEGSGLAVGHCRRLTCASGGRGWKEVVGCMY